ncbi:Mll3243 protein [hydrothermal vent metagenome]|uniref:Mll3243 protein n=1 Tax=hydrothermal vent metagenome TaxID=652676 RepID=A0A1W1CAR4_9ZZZZ
MGNFSVGKTSLIRRYVENSFSDKYLTTIGVKISKKSLTIDGDEMLLLIWDIEGALDHTRRVNKTYIKGANAAIVVTDVLSENIYDTLAVHLDDLKSVNGDIPTIIAINKIDIDEGFEIDLSQLKVSYPFIVDILYTSAKNNTNVEEIFHILSREIV